jgi:hypothetical protein
MTRGAADAESGVKECLKQRPMSRNLELRGSEGVKARLAEYENNGFDVFVIMSHQNLTFRFHL